MRVIAGTARGRRLKSVDDARVRPTTDRLKESLFSTLGPGIKGKWVLDLYAGSGGLGIEALSRGAAHAVFVESDRSAAEMIEANLTSTGLVDRAEVVRLRVERFAAARVDLGGSRTYDVVLADPPYESGLSDQVLLDLAATDRLSPNAMVVVEVSSRLKVPEPAVGYRLLDVRRYGDSRLIYLTQDKGGG